MSNESNLYHLPDEIKKELRIREDGVAVTSIRGCARICGVSHSTLIRNFAVVHEQTITDITISENLVLAEVDSGAEKTEKSFVLHPLAEKLIACGFDPSSFATEGIPDIAVAIIVKHYAVDVKEPKPEAIQAHEAFTALGVRTWFYIELGVPINTTTKESSDLIELKQLMSNQSALMLQQSEAINNLYGLVVSQQKDYELVKSEFRKEREYIKTNYLGIQRIIDAEKYKPTIFIGEFTLWQVMNLYRPQYSESKYCKNVYNKAKHSQRNFCERISLDTGRLWTIETISGCLVYKDYQIVIALVMLDSAAHRFCLENRLNFATTFGIKLNDLIQQELDSINQIIKNNEFDNI